MNTKHKNLFRKGVSPLILLCFLSGQVIPPSAAYAQSVLALPMPGTMVAVSPGYVPIAIKGLKVYPDNPFRFDFILDTGNSKLQGQELKDETSLLIKYFLTALTVPDDDQWVNLSPYEKDRIIPKEFGVTEMGRDLLAQDYLLKQLTASLIYPEHELGKKFWDKVHKKTHEKYGDVDIPVDTFNKVWIMPDHAKVYESGSMAFITESHLKVMLEKDYKNMSSLRKQGSMESQEMDSRFHGNDKMGKGNDIGSQILREIVLPEIEKEVNEGKNFTKLRQIYHSMIMAAWFKRKLMNGMLGKIYVGTNKVAGVDVEDKEIKQKIYDQYLAAFKQGVYNYIKEEVDEKTQETTPRKYFSGGFTGGQAVSSSTVFKSASSLDQLSKDVASRTIGTLLTAEAGLDSLKPKLASSSIFENMVRLSVGQGSWDQLQSQWMITELIFSPGGIENAGLQSADGSIVSTDIGGNRPFWVYILRNIENDAVAYAGRDDIKTLFPDRSKEIEEFMLKKVQERKEDFALLNRTRKLLGLFGTLGEAEDILSNLRSLDSSQIGDRDYEQIKLIYQQYADHWQKDFTADISLDRFLDILEDLTQTIMQSRRWNQLKYIDTSEQSHLEVIIKGRQMLSREDAQLMIRVHGQILEIKNSLQSESRAWGQRKAQVASEFVNARRPAYHANIWVANWLATHFSEKVKPLILDVGANASVLWGVLGNMAPSLQGSVIDLEADGSIYEAAPNPYRVHADISVLNGGALPKILEAKNGTSEYFDHSGLFDVVTINFVLDQLRPEQVRRAIKAIGHLLGSSAKKPLLIVTLPRNSPIQNSNFDKVLQELGYKVVEQAANLSNELTDEARERIRSQEGEDYLRTIEATFTQKVFHVGIYQKTREVSDEEVDQVDLSRLQIRHGAERIKTTEGESGFVAVRFNARDVDITDIFGGLRESDFEVKFGGEIVSRDEIEREARYVDFDKFLTLLLWLKKLSDEHSSLKLLIQFQRDLNHAAQIAEVWDVDNVSFLPQADVALITDAPVRIGLTLAQIKLALPHLASIFEKRQQKELEKWEQDNAGLAEGRYYAAKQKLQRQMTERIYSAIELFGLEEANRKTKQMESLARAVRYTDEFLIARKFLYDVERVALQLSSQANGVLPTTTEVAQKLGVPEEDIWYAKTLLNLGPAWLENNTKDIRNRDAKQRKKNIIEIARAFQKRSGKPPFISTIALQMGMSPNALITWKERNYKDEQWMDWGVALGTKIDDEQRKKEILKIAQQLELEGIVPTVTRVAQRLGLDMTSGLSEWKAKAFPDESWESWGLKPNIAIQPEKRKKQIIDAAHSLSEPNIENVAAKIGLSSGTLYRWKRENFPDETWETWGIRESPKDLEKFITQAAQRRAEITAIVKNLRSQDKIPDQAQIAAGLKISPYTLREWKRNYYPQETWESWGVILDESRDKESRIKAESRKNQIIKIAEELRAAGLNANITIVAEELGITGGPLIEWKDRYFPDEQWESWGVNPSSANFSHEPRVDYEQRLASLQSAVAELSNVGTFPNMTNVAKCMGISTTSLQVWLDKNFPDEDKRKSLGITLGKTDGDSRKKIIIQAARKIKERQQIPRISGIAREINLGIGQLLKWKEQYFPDENWESWGVMPANTSPVNAEDRKQAIIKVAAEMKAQKEVANISNVAKKLGVTGIALTNWKKRHYRAEPWELWGVEFNSMANPEKRLDAIKVAVAKLQSEATTPTVTSVAAAIGTTLDALSHWKAENYPDKEWSEWGVVTKGNRGIKDQQVETASSSLAKDLGGIDMNQKAMDLQVSGEEIKFDMSFDPAQLQNIQIDGFSPVILQIVPTNLPLFIGSAEPKDKMQVSSL